MIELRPVSLIFIAHGSDVCCILSARSLGDRRARKRQHTPGNHDGVLDVGDTGEAMD